jgi:hypothetical protein
MGNAYDGLPGVHGPSRCLPKRLTIGQMIMDEWLVPHEQLLRSNWFTRAWTYQEGALSTRRLFFTDHGVAFWCQQLYCQESIKERPLPLNAIDDSRAGEQLQDVIPRVADVFKRAQFPEVIGAYSQKTLSFDSDALNACLGILRALETKHYLERTQRTQRVPYLVLDTMDRSEALSQL